MMTNLSCGIDFGTSNSAIAVSATNSTPELVPVEDGKTTLPSAIFYAEAEKKAYYGRQATQKYVSGENGRFMRSLKRVLGTDLMASGTVVNGKRLSFGDILGGYLAHLKTKAESFVDRPLENVVMGRPVHFRDNDSQGDKQAQEELEKIAHKIGFKNVKFQYEPIAAAFAHEAQIAGEKLACVIDVGGGTSDFTVIRLGASHRLKSDRSKDILGSSGVRTGGNDFDRHLSMASFMPAFGYQSTYGKQNLFVPSSQYFELSEWSKVNGVYTYRNRQIVSEVLTNAHRPELYKYLLEILERESGHKILAEVEAAKIALTEQDSYCSIIKYLSDAPQIISTRKDFEHAISSAIMKIIKSLNECLSISGVIAEQIGLVVLTGGSTEIPYLQQVVHHHFPQAMFSSENKLSSVGLGLAYDSRRSFG